MLSNFCLNLKGLWRLVHRSAISLIIVSKAAFASPSACHKVLSERRITVATLRRDRLRNPCAGFGPERGAWFMRVHGADAGLPLQAQERLSQRVPLQRVLRMMWAAQPIWSNVQWNGQILCHETIA